jgi:hypothetical protein
MLFFSRPADEPLTESEDHGRTGIGHGAYGDGHPAGRAAAAIVAHLDVGDRRPTSPHR